MKNLYAAGLLWFLLFTAFTSHGQDEPPLHQRLPDNPSLFTALPDKIECDRSQLESLFSISPSERILFKVNHSFQFDGVLLEKFERSSHLTSLNIRLKNYPDALFTISRIEDKDGVTYTGRIVSPKHSDLLLLKKEKDRYFFIKEQQRFLMVE
jgi:hypothetical protein